MHVANCRECLPPEVIANMSKIGGSTEMHSLFDNQKAIDQFFKTVEATPFYQRHEEMLKSHQVGEIHKQTGAAKIKTILRNVLFTILHVNKEGRKKDAYLWQEMKLREYICYTYVILFEKLILSGEYNDQFGNEEIDLKLSDLL